jgi:cytoskeletal protein CcmA (bactofilin family)
MVFNRKPDSTPTPAADLSAPQMRRVDRPVSGIDRPIHAVSTPVDTQSVIGNDLSIEGQSITVRCKGTLRVLGNIEADVHSKELEVGKDATVQGSIAAETVNVHGRVSGAIRGAHVVLHATASVEGDIHSHLLSIEQGASFDGRSRRVANPSEIAPQLERGSSASSDASRTQFGTDPTRLHS